MIEFTFTKGTAKPNFDGSIDVILTVERDHRSAAEQFYSVMQGNDKPMTAKIGRKQNKRSLDSNSYMWVLCRKIADKDKLTREEVYRQSIRENGVYVDILVVDAAAETLIKRWALNGVGWFAEESHKSSKNPGCTVVRTYYGSSTYTQEEMSKLIDAVVYEAKTKGIETMTPDELARLKSEWGGAVDAIQSD